jgi:NitT/TauT family transport system ATP-binding protein
VKLEYSAVNHGFSGYAGTIPAVRNVNLSVDEGEFVVLLGPSGCGKSTLLNMAAGFIKPDEGEVLFSGKKIAGPGRERALVFQDSALMPWLSVEENILLAIGNRRLNFAQKRNAERLANEVTRVLDVVGLKGFNNAMPHELSVGMRQKVSIARGLIMEPQLLLMDEPFASLDEQTRLRLNREVVDIWIREPMTILFVTHSIQEALVVGTRIVLMSARPGCIISEWKLGSHGESGAERQRERLELSEYRDLSLELLNKMELCCPPESGCSTCLEKTR